MSIAFLNSKDLRNDIKNHITTSDLHIVSYPSSTLFNSADFCEYTNQHYLDALEMFALHYNSDGCAALAATQLSFKKPLAITVIDFSEEKNQPLCLINPKISERHGEQRSLEGCMSVFPEYIQGKVTRSANIRVQALDLHGNELDFHADGFMSKCIQHETDHLNGSLYINHLGGVEKRLLSTKIKKIIKKQGKQQCKK